MFNEEDIRKEFKLELERNETESYKEVMDYTYNFALRKAGTNLSLRDKIYRSLVDVAEEHLEERGLMEDESDRRD